MLVAVVASYFVTGDKLAPPVSIKLKMNHPVYKTCYPLLHLYNPKASGETTGTEIYGTVLFNIAELKVTHANIIGHNTVV